MKPRLIVVGNGMAGMRTVEELLKHDPDRYQIRVFGKEPYGNYNRIMLTPLLCGDKTLAEIMIHDLDWYRANRVSLHCGPGNGVVDVDRDRAEVITEAGERYPYDRLLLATGSNPLIIPVPGRETEGVLTFRDIADVQAMIEKAQTRQHAIVLGGGLLGLEAANGLLRRGMSVTVVDLAETLLCRQLDPCAGRLLEAELAARGIGFRLGTTIEQIISRDGHIHAVRFADGVELPADLLIMAAGVRPNTALGQRIGLACERGIIVDDGLHSSDPNIFAVGECIQHRGEIFGLVAPLYEQAKVCATQLAGEPEARYQSLVPATQLKVTGVELFSAGDFSAGPGREEILFHDHGLAVYKKIVLENDRIKGIVLYGDTTDSAWLFELLNQAGDVSGFRDRLLFGKPAADTETSLEQAA